MKAARFVTNKIDPLGFALGNYDESGGFRPTMKNRRRTGRKQSEQVGEIDTSGQLPSGEKFQSFVELKKILVTTQRRRIVQNVVSQMLSYALCRKLQIYDQPTVEAIVEAMDSGKGTWRELVFEIANSLPFRKTIVLKDELGGDHELAD